MSRWQAVPAFVLACFLVLVDDALAQRETAELRIKDLRAAIEYGVVRAGRHTRDALEVGKTWRMGRNEASVIILEMPLIGGDTVIAPGSYRVAITRPGENDFRLAIVAGALGLNPDQSGGDLDLAGKLEPAPKPFAKLEVALRPEKKDSGPTNPVLVDVGFGADHLLVPAVVVTPSKSMKAQSWVCHGFNWPADLLSKRVDAGERTPIARLARRHPTDTKKVLTFNLLLGKEEVLLAPVMEAPTESFGFGNPTPPDKEMIERAPASWTGAQSGPGVLQLSNFQAKSDELKLEIAFGQRALTLAVPDPCGKKGRSN